MGWGWGGDAARTVRGAGGGAGRRGNLGARRASRASRPKERQEEPDFRHHPQTSRSDPSPSGRAQRPFPGSPRWRGAAPASVICADGRCRGLSLARTGTRPGRGPASFACPCQDVPQGKCAPQSNKFNQIPPAPPSERTLDSPDASRLERGHPKFSGRHVVKISRPSYTWSGADDEDGSPGIPSPPVPQTTPPHPATVS